MIPEFVRTGLDASIRISVIAVVIAGLLAAARVRVSSVRHAAWTAVLLAMLLMPVLPSVVPSIDVPVPRSAGAEPRGVADALIFAPPSDESYRTVTPSTQAGSGSMPSDGTRSATAFEAGSPSVRPTIAGVVIAVYALVAFVLLARLVLGWWASVRVVKQSSPVDAGRRLPDPLHGVREASIVATPLTIGIVRPRVVLPLEWRQWSSPTLAAVLAHEGAHIRRRDPLVSFLAHVNRCVFWFHPLAWWLERTLASTAEDACDDAGVTAIGESKLYAAVLLDIADAVRRRGNRLSWQGVGIDGNGLIAQRIERILGGDLFRQISRTRRGVVAIGCAAAILLVVACRQKNVMPGPVADLTPDPQIAATIAKQKAEQQAERKLSADGQAMTLQQAAEAEAALVKNPEDLDTRKKLLDFYQWTGKNPISWEEDVAARRRHALWLIEHHPDIAVWSSAKVRAVDDPTGYAEARKVWMTVASQPGVTAKVLGRAAWFFDPTDKPAAEQMLLRAQALEPASGPDRPQRLVAGGVDDHASWSSALGWLYAEGILGIVESKKYSISDDFSEAEAHGAFANDARQKLEVTRDRAVLASAAQYLLNNGHSYSLRPGAVRPGQQDTTLLGRHYLERAQQIDPQSVMVRDLAAREAQVDRAQHLRSLIPLIQRSDPAALAASAAKLSDADRLEVLPRLAEVAYASGNTGWVVVQNKGYRSKVPSQEWWDLSRRLADESLQLAAKSSDAPKAREAVFQANTILGTLALRSGDRVAAVKYMLAASEAGPTDAPGPTELPYYLLKYGERDSVALYFERTGQAMSDPSQKASTLAAAAAIRAGKMPESYQRWDAK
jgi:beta-lactamase regulating signal transducer with metallopeptidase domain